MKFNTICCVLLSWVGSITSGCVGANNDSSVVTNEFLSVSQCVSAPSTSISERNIVEPHQEGLYGVHRAVNGDIIVEDRGDGCYISISSLQGYPLEFASPEESAGYSLIDSYKNTADVARRDFLDRCRNTDQYKDEVARIRDEQTIPSNLPDNAVVIIAALPCDILYEEFLLHLKFRFNSTESIGGVHILKNQIVVWNT